MSIVQFDTEPTRPTAAFDAFEEGWDMGVDWANEHADYRSLLIAQQLHARHCGTLEALLEALSCDAETLFPGHSGEISDRHVEGFIDGAVAILREGGM